jgi:hypothetical protein
MPNLVSNPVQRGELFTGYFAHVSVTDREVEVTTVGDCYAAINGTTTPPSGTRSCGGLPVGGQRLTVFTYSTCPCPFRALSWRLLAPGQGLFAL